MNKIHWEVNYSSTELDKSMADLLNKLPKRGVLCECLIDQNRTIGGDPVGYGCTNRATKKADTEFGTAYFCDSCVALLIADPMRVTYRFMKEE